jgi:L-lactate dehydrogenase (cytochrome)
MKLREISSLIRVERPDWRPGRRRLRRVHQIEDLLRLAQRRMPGPVFDYVEGGADEELSLAANRRAYRRWELVPQAPRDVSQVDTSTELFGRRIALPLLCSPTGYTRMMHPAGERAVARAAARAGLPYGLSTVASTSIEDVASTGHPDLWFQLYVWRDRGMTADLVDRAWATGYRVLEVSIDVAVTGLRIRDVRNGLTIPPRLTAGTLFEIARKPGYWVNMLSRPAIVFANSPPNVRAGGGITVENMTAQFDPTLSWADIAGLRERWPGSLVIKGPLGAEGARAALDAGADGLHLSNHGGRQLDRIVPPVEMVPEVREAAGDRLTVIVDSGIRHGIDLAVALARGADAGAIGRPYLYGLMAGGEAGVDVALRILGDEFRRALALLGLRSAAELRSRGEAVLRPSRSG